MFVLAYLLCSVGLPLVTVGCSPSEPDPVHAPLTQAQQAMLERGNLEYTDPRYRPPVATFWDKADNFYRGAKSTGGEVAVTAGKVASIGLLHVFMLGVNIFIIAVILETIFGKVEAPIEGVLIGIFGLVLLTSKWVVDLGQTHWVMAYTFIPAGVIFFLTIMGAKKHYKWAPVIMIPVFALLTFMTFVFGAAVEHMTKGTVWGIALVAFIAFMIYGFFFAPPKEKHS